MDNQTKLQFQRAGLMAAMTSLATNPNVDEPTRLAITESLLGIIKDNQLNDEIEEITLNLLMGEDPFLAFLRAKA